MIERRTRPPMWSPSPKLALRPSWAEGRVGLLTSQWQQWRFDEERRKWTVRAAVRIWVSRIFGRFWARLLLVEAAEANAKLIESNPEMMGDLK